MNPRGGKCVFLTGPTGFLGSSLLKKFLELDYRIVVVTRKEIELPQSNVNVILIKDDLSSLDSIYYKKIFSDYAITDVVHCAGISKERFFLPWSCYDKVNVKWPTVLAKAVLASDSVTNFIYISSVGVYGTIPFYQPASEDHPYMPDGKYHLSKVLAEKSLRNICPELERKNKRIYILRLNTLYGPNDKGVLWKIISYAHKGFLPIFDNPSTTFCSVDLVFELIDKLIWSKTKLSSNIFNVSERPFYLRDFLNTIRKSFLTSGRRFKFMVLPKICANILLLTKASWLANRISLLAMDKVYNINKLEQLLCRMIKPMEYFELYRNYYLQI